MGKSKIEAFFGLSLDEIKYILKYLYLREKNRQDKQLEDDIAVRNNYLLDSVFITVSDPKLFSKMSLVQTLAYSTTEINRNNASYESFLVWARHLLDNDKYVSHNHFDSHYSLDRYLNRLSRDYSALAHESEATTDSANILDYLPSTHSSIQYKALFAIVCLFESYNSRNFYRENIISIVQHLPYALSEVLYSLIFQNQKDNLRENADRNLSYFCKSFISRSSMESFAALILAAQLSVYCERVLQNEQSNEHLFQQISYKIALYFLGSFFSSNDLVNSLKFFPLAASVNDNSKRLTAFNYLGLCAIDNKQYQFAYDVFFSWLNSVLIDSIKNTTNMSEEISIKIDKSLKSKQESDWRTAYPTEVAVMYNNAAYVCGELYDLLNPSSLKDQLINLSRYFILKAIKLNPDSSNYHSTAGSIFDDADEINESLFHYQEVYRLSHSPKAKTSALRHILREYFKILDESMHNDFDIQANAYLTEYSSLMDECEIDSADLIYDLEADKETDLAEVLYGRNLYFLLSKCSRLSEDCQTLKYELFKIDNIARTILSTLKRSTIASIRFDLHFDLISQKEKAFIQFPIDALPFEDIHVIEKEIAYYTTLKTLAHLFEEIDPKTGQKITETNIKLSNKSDDKSDSNNNQTEQIRTINCLTMMHARYMNDPEEGLVLFKHLKESLPETPEKLRDTLYDQKFVFLKSFTGLIDKLNMWSMYGSDLNEGKDSNGCCVVLAPESFDTVSDLNKKSDSKVSSHFDDSFELYNVAYIDENKIYVNDIRSKILEKLFSQLKEKLYKISGVLKTASEEDIILVSECLVRLLEKPMFLFKEYSYHQECESRIIITRDFIDRKEIKKTEATPQKLFINPLFQVFPEKIILGPNVDTPDNWIPHLQYELSKIHDKWCYESKREFKPIVRLSEIHYR